MQKPKVNSRSDFVVSVGHCSRPKWLGTGRKDWLIWDTTHHRLLKLLGVPDHELILTKTNKLVPWGFHNQ